MVHAAQRTATEVNNNSQSHDLPIALCRAVLWPALCAFGKAVCELCGLWSRCQELGFGPVLVSKETVLWLDRESYKDTAPTSVVAADPAPLPLLTTVDV